VKARAASGFGRSTRFTASRPVVVALMRTEKVNQHALIYLNRLSDFLFVLARAANAGGTGDVLWVPGANRG